MRKVGEVGDIKVATHESHPFAPVFDENSRILILGSFPSVKSRENAFYYGHPRNRFWEMLARIFGEEMPELIQEKTDFLLRNKIALWDVVASCDILNSSDSSIKNAVPNDIERIVSASKIEKILTNGEKASSLFRKFFGDSLKEKFGIEVVALPSTSPANMKWGIDELVEEWGKHLKSL